MSRDRTYISVDVETSGPNPGGYSLLSIGACTVTDERQEFYVELQPVSQAAEPGALRICGLSMNRLAREGVAPPEAMARFATWLAEVVPDGQQPLFVAFNAPFDWMWVADYFYRYLGRNPFGHSALDLKAFYMGLAGVTWSETSMARIADHFPPRRPLTHNALQDALDQADLFEQLLELARTRGGST